MDIIGLTDDLPESDLIRVEGVVENIIYCNDENYYTICELDTDGDPVTLVGTMPYINEGETISALGKWVVHPHFGKQFKVENFEKQLPVTSEAIYRYLCTGAVKGIGPITAKRIVGRFGADTFDVIEHHPEWLADIQGISPKKAADIGNNYKAQFGIRTVMTFCSEFFGAATSVRIYNAWGVSAVDVLKNQPFRLCDEIYGVGFEKADRIASRFGISPDAPERLRAGIKYILNFNAFSNGHCYLPYDRFVQAACKLLGCDDDKVENEIGYLRERAEIYVINKFGNKRVYLEKYYRAEQYIANKLAELQRSGVAIDEQSIERITSQIEFEQSIKYASMQKKAIHTALKSGLMILTGGPGTGKTTIICAILRILCDMGMRVALCAPTGRAAKRMSEATDYEAKTIHRLLEMEYSRDREPVFNRDENNLLEEDTVIVDESSMVDVLLMESLLRAIKPGGHLILIGDADQLPSVGAGNVLRDLIDSDAFPTIKLTKIFRQAGESLIITNAHSINHGEYPILSSKNNDFFFIERNNEADIAATVTDLCVNRLPKKYHKTVNDGIQVITPSHGGIPGTDNLNELLHKACNPQEMGKKHRKAHGIEFRVGDKVMQTRNNYDIEWTRGEQEGVGIFNGDIGFIVDIDERFDKVIINFDERIAKYDTEMLEDVEHAYAITIHKSQGSEYPIVIIPSYEYSRKLLTRNLLYTAVTRAQEMVIIVGSKAVVYQMVDNNHLDKRYTGLKSAVETLVYGEER